MAGMQDQEMAGKDGGVDYRFVHASRWRLHNLMELTRKVLQAGGYCGVCQSASGLACVFFRWPPPCSFSSGEVRGLAEKGGGAVILCPASDWPRWEHRLPIRRHCHQVMAPFPPFTIPVRLINRMIPYPLAGAWRLGKSARLTFS